MPQRKRALEGMDASTPPASKRSSTSKASENEPEDPAENQPSAGSVDGAEEVHSHNHDHGLDRKKPEEYICIDRPLFDFEAEHQDKNENDDREGDEDEDDEEAAFEEYRKAAQGPNKRWPKPAAEDPSWKWVMMVDSWKMFCELRIKQTYVDPDNFGMYVFNDFYGYGINSLIEDMINEFDKEYSKKKERSLHHMWAIMATLGHWMNDNETMSPWLGIDDSDRVDAFVTLIGCAFLSALDAIDQAGKLKQHSEFRDLGLVMSLYLEWSRDLPVYGNGAGDWRRSVFAYAKKGGIDLEAAGCHGITKSLEEYEELRPLQNKPAGRWRWPANYKGFKLKFGFVRSSIPFNLPCYDITKWPRKLRAKWNYDNVDPLADIPEKDLKEGNIMLG